MKSLVCLMASVSVLAFSDSSEAATKVGIVGAANPVLMAESEEGIKRELYAGDTVFMGEKLISSESGSAQLMFLDRSALMIGPSANVTIDTFVYDPATELGEMSMNAGVGAFRFIGGALSKKNPVTIKTPISTMGIRGGIGDIDVGTDGQTRGVFHHGEAMTMTNPAGVTTVTTTSGSGFVQPDAAARPTPLSGEQMRQHMQQSPVKVAANVAAPASPQQLNQMQSRMDGGVAPTAPSDVPTPEQPQAEQPQTSNPAEQTAPGEPAPEQSQAEQQQTPDTETGEPEQATSSPQETTQSPQEKPEATLNKPATDSPLSKGEIQDVKANPKQLLEKFPKGGPEMADYVARGVATDPSLIDSLGEALKEANPAQSAAMGAGMVRGARLVGQQDPEALKDLRQRVDNLNNPTVSRTFNAIGPEVQQIGSQLLPPAVAPQRVVGPSVGTKVEPKAQKRTFRTPQDLEGVRNSNGKMQSIDPSQRANEKTPDSLQTITTIVDPAIAATVTGVAAFEKQNPSIVNPAVATTVTGVVAADPVDNDAKPTSPSR